jgi:hypothetical protein
MIRFLLFCALTAVYAFLLGWPVHWLWNKVVPDLFHLTPIDFLQGVALVAIARVLFGLRLVAFLLWSFALAVGLGWVGQWLWNQVGPQIFHLPTITWFQAGALVGLFQILFGGAHHWKRMDGLTIWRTGRWKNGEAWNDHLEDHGRMHKEEWRAFRRGMRRWGKHMHDEGRRWKERAEEAAPGGSHRNWRHFEGYWREKGKADFEAWLERMRRGEG